MYQVVAFLLLPLCKWQSCRHKFTSGNLIFTP